MGASREAVPAEMAQLNSPVDYHEALAKITSGITQLTTEPRGSSQPFPQQYWMELYTLVFKICSNAEDPRPHKLYTDVSALLVGHCQGFRQMLEQKLPQDLLPAYLRIFERFFTGMENVAAILNYLNRWWIKSQSALPDFDAHAAGVYSVDLLPYVIWYDEVYIPLQEGIFAAMMDRRGRKRRSCGDARCWLHTKVPFRCCALLLSRTSSSVRTFASCRQGLTEVGALGDGRAFTTRTQRSRRGFSKLRWSITR